MLTFSIMGWVVLFLFAVMAVFLVYQVFKKDEDDELTNGFNADDTEYGSFLDVDPFFLYQNNIRQDATIQVSLPLPATPENCVRAEIDHLTFFDIPYSVIDNVHTHEESTKAFKEKEWNKSKKDNVYQKPIGSPNASDGIALGLFAGQLSSEPDQYTRIEESPVNFGNGGEFAGGGASGSWNDNMPSSSSHSDSYSSDTLSYSSTDSSSDYSSGSSYSDSSSSDTSSSSSDTW